MRDAGPRPEGSAGHHRDGGKAPNRTPPRAIARGDRIVPEAPYKKRALGDAAGAAACARAGPGRPWSRHGLDSAAALFTRRTGAAAVPPAKAKSACAGQNNTRPLAAAPRRQCALLIPALRKTRPRDEPAPPDQAVARHLLAPGAAGEHDMPHHVRLKLRANG